ncbi:MAG: hypothetical protein ACPLQS_01575 [Desulfurococcaceae archaeon]
MPTMFDYVAGVSTGIIEDHYSKLQVRQEIAEYCKSRWIAVEGSYGDKRVFIRYTGGKPLVFNTERDVASVFRRYGRLNARTIYATINLYRDLSDSSLVDKADNVVYTTVFWDIDTVFEKWEYALRAAEVIAEYLESEGVSESTYIAWSGEGAHVRLHERAFSQELLSRNHPLDVAYAVADYVLRNTADKLEQLTRESGGVLKVENLVDPKRVFTAPLSLHRRRDLVVVFFDLDDVASFNPSWADPSNPRHRSNWRRFKEGEADELALKALKTVSERKSRLLSKGGSAGRVVVQAMSKSIEAKQGNEKPQLIGRFQVMGLLQAARYYLLTGDMEKAKSFGLNRAIFYAWAKHYGKGYVPKKITLYSTGPPIPENERKLVEVAGEEAYVSPRGFFMIGDREQSPGDYDRNIASKINQVIPYEVAWEAALKYLARFPETTLRDQRLFYEKVYEPVRDRFKELVEQLADEEAGEDKKPEVKEKERVREHGKPKAHGLFKWVKKID